MFEMDTHSSTDGQKLFYNVPPNDPLYQALDYFAHISEPIKDAMGVAWCTGSDTWYAGVRSTLSAKYRWVQLLRMSCALHFCSVRDGEQHISMRVSSTDKFRAISEVTSRRGLDG